MNKNKNIYFCYNAEHVANGKPKVSEIAFTPPEDDDSNEWCYFSGTIADAIEFAINTHKCGNNLYRWKLANAIIDRIEEFDRDFINYNVLQEFGEKKESALDGTCLLYELGVNEYIVLADNTVITREDDNDSDDPIFPY